MNGPAMREVFEAILPQGLIEDFARLFGVVERERVFDVAVFVRASVIAAGSPLGGLQADAIRNYLESGGPEHLGRVLTATAGAQQLFAYAYDNAGGTAPTGCGTLNTLGRVRLQQDSFGATWFSYDALGRVVAEKRSA